MRAGATTVEVAALAPDLFRVGMFPAGGPPRYDSEGIAKEDWEPVEVSMQESDEELTLSTTAATARVSLNPLRIGFADPSGREFAVDDEELGMGAVETPGADVFSEPLGSPVRLYKRREAGERYFGCGERTSGLEKTGSHQVFYNVDPPLGHTASFNNLYSSIPFTFSMTNGKAHGLFFDNTHRVEFDLALEDENRAYYGAEGGAIVYYVFCGPTPREVVGRYTELTGRTPMPPLWTLGNQQCRYSYMNEEEVREVASGFRERDIPCDVIYLDIHYMDGYRVFTWNEDRFPDPRRLISDLREQGFRVVTIVDPGVKVDENYSVYTEGRERDLYCKTREGEEYHNAVWPGVCAFPDFTNPETREWWGENQRVLTDAGVAGIWCDMNEPALFIPDGATMPDDVVHPGGRAGEARWHAQIHNTYGSLMARAAREGLLALRPDERPFVITRAGYAGLQRHAMHWTGDNSSWWEHLWMSMPQLQNLALSGVAWAGVDVGGFRRRHERRAPGPLDGVRGLPTLLPQPHHYRDPPPGAVGLRRALRVGVQGDDQTSPAPPALPLLALRRVPQDGRADPAPPPLRVPRGRDDLHGRRRVPARRRPPRRPHHPPRYRAPPRLPARGHLVPLLQRRAIRGAGPHPGARTPGRARPLREGRLAHSDGARCGPHGREAERPADAAGLPGQEARENPHSTRMRGTASATKKVSTPGAGSPASPRTDASPSASVNARARSSPSVGRYVWSCAAFQRRRV